MGKKLVDPCCPFFTHTPNRIRNLPPAEPQLQTSMEVRWRFPHPADGTTSVSGPPCCLAAGRHSGLASLVESESEHSHRGLFRPGNISGLSLDTHSVVTTSVKWSNCRACHGSVLWWCTNPASLVKSKTHRGRLDQGTFLGWAWVHVMWSLPLSSGLTRHCSVLLQCTNPASLVES